MSDTENASQSLALRREARKRRILENSTNRLKLIEGVASLTLKSSEEKIYKHSEEREVTETESNELQNVPNDENSQESDSNSDPNDLFKDRTLNQLPIFNLKDEIETEEGVDEYKDEDEDEEDDDDDDDEEEEEEDEIQIGDGKEQVQKSYITVILEKRLHYVLLACLVNLMLFFDFGFLIYENIFCPFYTIKMIEWLAERQKKRPMRPMMMLLTAGLPQPVRKFMVTVYSVTTVLLSDLCIYIFSFVMGTKLIYTET